MPRQGGVVAEVYLLKYMRKIFSAGLIILPVVAVIIFFSPEAMAFTVTPGRVEVTIPAGESYEGSFNVANPDSSAVEIKVSAEDWSSAKDVGKTAAGETPFLAWLEISPKVLKLGPSETGIINYKATLPKETKGELSAMIYFGTGPAPMGGSVSVVSRVGNALYVIAKGTEIVKGELIDIIISKTNPLKADVAVKNAGNVHVRPKGKLLIQKRGKKPVELSLNDAGFPVLPGQTYIFEAWSKKKISPGLYSCQLNMKFGEESFDKKFEFIVDAKGKASIKEEKGKAK